MSVASSVSPNLADYLDFGPAVEQPGQQRQSRDGAGKADDDDDDDVCSLPQHRWLPPPRTGPTCHLS
jgi:hypothetical protein